MAFPPRRVIFATDFSPASEEAGAVAAAIARASGAELDVVWCVPLRDYLECARLPGLRVDEGALRARLTSQGLARAQPQLAAFRDLGLQPAFSTRFGGAAEDICGFAEERHADLVVVGSRGAGATRALLGSVAERVVRHAPCPVLVARAGR